MNINLNSQGDTLFIYTLYMAAKSKRTKRILRGRKRKTFRRGGKRKTFKRGGNPPTPATLNQNPAVEQRYQRLSL